MSNPKDPPESDLPRAIDQNPAPVVPDSQQYSESIQEQVQLILRDFLELHTASNYVSQITGPYYSLQFQALAEQISKFTIMAEEAALDQNFEFTRSEFLWQVMGTLVFPDTSRGIPRIPGDQSYRCFLQDMIGLLLAPATAENNREGIQLLTDALVTLIEKFRPGLTDPNTFWDAGFQFEFEVNVQGKGQWTVTNPDGSTTIIEGDYGTGFPTNPFLIQQAVAVLNANVDLVIRALKPGHTLMEYRYLFLDQLNEITDEPRFDAFVYYYDDMRKFCQGAKELASTNGETLTDRTLFRDTSLDFKSVNIGAPLTILDGPNSAPINGGQNEFRRGMYQVVEKLRTISGADVTPRSYTSAPTGLTGELTVEEGGILDDPNQDWSNAAEGEVVTIASGPNAGNYRLDWLLGSNGGAVGDVSPGSGVTRVRVAVGILRVDTRMPFEASGQSYVVEVDRLGVRVPMPVAGEDASEQFYQ